MVSLYSLYYCILATAIGTVQYVDSNQNMHDFIRPHSVCTFWFICCWLTGPMYRPFSGDVASRLATAVFVAMVTPILYDNF